VKPDVCRKVHLGHTAWKNQIPLPKAYAASHSGFLDSHCRRYFPLFARHPHCRRCQAATWRPVTLLLIGINVSVFIIATALGFLRTDSGIQESVLKEQRGSAAVFIVVSILNAARVQGIDNAAHLGGLAAGLIMGWLLFLPLDAKRNEVDWTSQWVRACAVIVGSVLLVGYYLSNGKWHPRTLYDASGRPILLAELVPPPHTFGGVTLGMTSTELRHARGTPLRAEPERWLYNSIDLAHNGVLEAHFRESPAAHPATVWAVLFWGSPEAAPPGMTNLLGFTRQGLIARYGSPRAASGPDQDTGYLYFRNGIMVMLRDGKVTGYGVYIPTVH
jgi:rhomboid family protein